MPQPVQHPGALRILLGFILAPLIPALAFSLIASFDLRIFSAALLYGGYPPAIVLGVPAYFLLRNHLQPRFWLAMLVGGFIAALPWVALSLMSTPSHAEVGQCVSVVDGKHTWCGLWEIAKFAAMVFPFGALGGLVFWLCVAWRLPRSLPAT